MISGSASSRYHCPSSLGDLPKAPVQFAARGAVGILASDRAPCRNVAGTPPGSDVRSWLGVRFILHPCMLSTAVGDHTSPLSVAALPLLHEAKTRIEIEALRMRERVRNRSGHASRDVRDAVLKAGLESGTRETFGRLADERASCASRKA
jgi:hypothetical protein